MAKQPSGIASAENLRDWANYARSHSVDYSPIKAQSKKDLGPIETSGRETDWIPNDSNWREDQKKIEGQGWRHWSEVSQRNSYTGKGGSKRD
jgi:hypothetical protein